MHVDIDTSPDCVPGGLRHLACTVADRLAELFAARREELAACGSVEDSIRSSAGQEKVWSGRRYRWAGTLQDALGARPTTPWEGKRHADAVSRRAVLLARIAVIDQEMAELAAVYEEFRWNRAFLVTSSNGHVHKTMACSTCRPATEFVWLPQYSGAGEAEIVGDAGETACTVCYPSAPADVLNRPSRVVTADRAAKEVARTKGGCKSGPGRQA